MRLAAIATLAVLAACSADTVTAQQPAELAPPPGAPLTLEVSALVPGATASFTIGNGDVGEDLWLVRSMGGTGVGPCPGPLGGMCADVVPPMAIMGPFTASTVGAATANPTIPAGVPSGTHVCFQAMARRGAGGVDSVKSPVVCRVVDGGPVALIDGANTGDTFDDGWVYGGSNLYIAFKHTVTTPGDVSYVEAFTGEATGLGELSLWSHDATNDQPLAPLAGTAWTVGLQNEWQGGPLDTTVSMAAGETYWVVLKPTAGQSSRDVSGGTSVQYKAQNPIGSGTWTGPFSNVEKYKLCAGGGCP